MRFLALLLLSGIVSAAYSQTREIDSLQRVSGKLSGIERVDALNKLAWALVFYDLNKSKAIAAQARELSDKLKYDKGRAEALIDEGFCELKVGNTSVSIQKFKESIELSGRIKQDTLQGFALIYLGLNYQNLDRLDSSIYFLNQSYEILKDSTQPYYLSLLYMILADHYEMVSQPVLQLKYLDRSWAIRDQLKDKRYLAYTSERLSSYFIQRGDYDKALSYLNHTQKALGKDTVNNEEINIIYRQRAIIYLKQGYYPAALRYLSMVIKFYEGNSFTKELTGLLIQAGDLFYELDNFEVSLKNYFRAFDIAGKNGYEFERTNLMIKIGRVYLWLDQPRLSIEFGEKALASAQQNNHPQLEAAAYNLLGLVADGQSKFTEAMNYFDKALQLRTQIDDKLGVAATVFNMAVVYEEQGELDKALEYQLKSLAIEEPLNNRLGVAYSYQGLGQLYVKLKNFGKAEEYLNKAEQLSKKIRSGRVLADVLKTKRDILLAQSKFEQAARYSIIYENLKDSIFNENLGTRMATLQNLFELDQKDNAIKLLNQEKEIQKEKLEIQESQIRQQLIIIIAGSVSLVGISLLAYFIYRYYAKIKLLNREISERTEEIQAQSEELLESNQTLTKLNRDIIERNEEIQAQSEELTEANEALSRFNDDINDQKQTIQAQAEALAERHQEILTINESLEERIEERTSELKQAYKELDTFFYRSSHDFRRPLTTFMGLAEVAKVTIKDAAALELFEKVNETARNLDKMLMKLQSISDVGLQELIYKDVFLYDLFVRELDSFRESLVQKSIRTEIDVDKNLSICSYPALIKIIIENLIENAISFSGVNDAFIRLKAYPKDDEVVMEIEDNGQGIEPEYLPRVFDMYFRGNDRSKGNGLGLYIVKKTVDKLKARIRLESIVGKGTKISIFFPIPATKATPV